MLLNQLSPDLAELLYKFQRRWLIDQFVLFWRIFSCLLANEFDQFSFLGHVPILKRHLAVEKFQTFLCFKTLHTVYVNLCKT